jgi:DNA repair protein RadC
LLKKITDVMLPCGNSFLINNLKLKEMELTDYKETLRQFETSLYLAEIQVSYKTTENNKVKINHSKDAFEILYSLFNKDTIEYLEQFYLLLLNKANKMLGWINLSNGGTTGTIVDVKVIYAIALITNSSSVALCHNHPSGNIQPSEADKNLTKVIYEAGKLLSINLIDHIIISPDKSYYSFADEGILSV